MTISPNIQVSSHNWPAKAGITWTALLEQGSRAYERARMLPRLLPSLALPSGLIEPATTRYIIQALGCAMRKQRARAGHWTYDLNRHMGLNQALNAERKHLAQLKASAKKTPPSPEDGV